MALVISLDLLTLGRQIPDYIETLVISLPFIIINHSSAFSQPLDPHDADQMRWRTMKTKKTLTLLLTCSLVSSRQPTTHYLQMELVLSPPFFCPNTLKKYSKGSRADNWRTSLPATSFWFGHSSAMKTSAAFRKRSSEPVHVKVSVMSLILAMTPLVNLIQQSRILNDMKLVIHNKSESSLRGTWAK